MTGAMIRQVQTDKTLVNDLDPDIFQNKTMGGTIEYYTNAEIAICCSFLVGCYQLIFGNKHQDHFQNNLDKLSKITIENNIDHHQGFFDWASYRCICLSSS